tara:strand:- start:228 stop:539 length:312 start_codon:yes stop_codon:yes gene_type:complete
MKFTLEQITQIIKEEIAAVLSEDMDRPDEELLDLVLDVAKDPINADYFDLQDIEDELLSRVRAGMDDIYDEDDVEAAAEYLTNPEVGKLEKLPNGDYKFIPEG